MAHAVRLPPVWPFLDNPITVTIHLLNLEEFTELLNRCAPDVIVLYSFAILRTLVTARYLHAKVQGLHKFHEEIGDMEAERVQLRQAVPTDEVGGQALRLGRFYSIHSPLESQQGVQRQKTVPARPQRCTQKGCGLHDQFPELLTATQVVINTWEKEYFKQRAPDDTKRKSTVPSADPNKRPRSEDYLVHSYVLFTPPVGRGNKL